MSDLQERVNSVTEKLEKAANWVAENAKKVSISVTENPEKLNVSIQRNPERLLLKSASSEELEKRSLVTLADYSDPGNPRVLYELRRGEGVYIGTSRMENKPHLNLREYFHPDDLADVSNVQGALYFDHDGKVIYENMDHFIGSVVERTAKETWWESLVSSIGLNIGENEYRGIGFSGARGSVEGYKKGTEKGVKYDLTPAGLQLPSFYFNMKGDSIDSYIGYKDDFKQHDPQPYIEEFQDGNFGVLLENGNKIIPGFNYEVLKNPGTSTFSIEDHIDPLDRYLAIKTPELTVRIDHNRQAEREKTE